MENAIVGVWACLGDGFERDRAVLGDEHSIVHGAKGAEAKEWIFLHLERIFQALK